MEDRFLTKTRFKTAMECPTKLFYVDKDSYANKRMEDSFLEALAEGGFQVAELAKCYYRKEKHIDLNGMNTEEALRKTSEHIKLENIIIFEAAIIYNNFLIRADILIKRKNSLKIIEIKSSSVDPTDTPIFMAKRGGIKSDWKEYLYDIAFQKFVLQNAFSDKNITAYLMLMDKTSISPVEGLNQKFKINKNISGKVKVVISDTLLDTDLSIPILKEINVDDEVRFIFENEHFLNKMNFSQYAQYLSDMFANDMKISPKIGSICGKCEFRSEDSDESSLKNGFKECWIESCGFKESDFVKPLVLDLWQYRKKDRLIENGIYHLSNVNFEDISPKPDLKFGLSRSERQWLQVEKAKTNDDSYEIDINGLTSEIVKWKYPLHFIDFETATPAIPLNKDSRPYQGFAFQFSHHVLYEDGEIDHKSQFINSEIGINPNISFIRALMSSLSSDNGTIFRYHNHENTFLNIIYHEVVRSKNPLDDKEAIIKFIQSISLSTKDNYNAWEKGTRCMVDLCNLVERYTYDPLTMGKTSIKKIFPAILKRSKLLQEKYSKPIYGSENYLKSLNFKNMQWVQFDGDRIRDPYQLLEPLFLDINLTDNEIERLFPHADIRGGGTASMAYLRMQFSEMSEIERQGLTESLLKYCELDTLAMVMLVEAWLDMVKS